MAETRTKNRGTASMQGLGEGFSKQGFIENGCNTCLSSDQGPSGVKVRIKGYLRLIHTMSLHRNQLKLCSQSPKPLAT